MGDARPAGFDSARGLGSPETGVRRRTLVPANNDRPGTPRGSAEGAEPTVDTPASQARVGVAKEESEARALPWTRQGAVAPWNPLL